MKPIEIVFTSNWLTHFGQGTEFSKIFSSLFEQNPFSMFIFESDPPKMFLHVSIEGTDMETGDHIESAKEIYRKPFGPIKTFWCIVDDYGDRYVATFLFPEDY